MPIIWLTALLIYAVFTTNQKRRENALIATLFVFLFFTHGFIANELFSFWEKDPIQISILPEYETGIVLTGVTNNDRSSEDRVYFNKGADRVLHTVQLFKLGKIKNILITGGTPSLSGEVLTPEALNLKSVFIYCGIPEKNIITESNSRNTRENATYSKRVIDSLQLKGKFLLITSAFHMRRAEGCFKKVNIDVDIYPVDYYTTGTKLTPDRMVIPSPEALNKWSMLIHEITGYIVYKISGYC